MYFSLELLGNTAVGIFIFCSIVPIVSMGVLTNTGFTSGAATKVIAVLTFLVGATWFVFGSMLARKLNNGYRSFVPSGMAFKKYAENPEGNGKLMAGGMIAAVTIDSVWIRVMMEVLPFPLNYFYYMGIYPIIPFMAFGLFPAVVTWMSLGSLMSLASVMDAGGDGTEYVEAKKIHWFYSLSASDRDRVREGSDLDGEDDSEDDSDSDEEAGLVKKAPKKVRA